MGGPARFESSWKWTERLQEESPTSQLENKVKALQGIL